MKCICFYGNGKWAEPESGSICALCDVSYVQREQHRLTSPGFLGRAAVFLAATSHAIARTLQLLLAEPPAALHKYFM